MGKRILKEFKSIDGGDVSTNLTGISTNVESLDKLLFVFFLNGTASGNYDLQISNDNETFIALGLNISPPPGGFSLINVELVNYAWIRPVCSAGGTGTLDVTINGSQIGGQ